MGQPPAPLPVFDAADDVRQDVAVALERVIIISPDAPYHEVLDTYLQDLGGVWVPPPRDEDPSPVSPSEVDPPADLDQALQDASATLVKAMQASSGDHQEAYGSMWLTLQLALADEDIIDAPACADSCGKNAIPISDPNDLDFDVVISHAPEMVGVYDALGYFEEIQASQADEDSRDEIAAGAQSLRAFAGALAGEAAGTSTDSRLSAYRGDTSAPEAAVAEYLQQALAGWLTVLAHADRDQIEPVAAAAWHAYSVTNPDYEPWPGLAN